MLAFAQKDISHCVCLCMYPQKTLTIMTESFAVFHLQWKQQRKEDFGLLYSPSALASHSVTPSRTSHHLNLMMSRKAGLAPGFRFCSHPINMPSKKNWQLAQKHLAQLWKRWEGERCHHMRLEVIPSGSVGKCVPVETHKGEPNARSEKANLDGVLFVSSCDHTSGYVHCKLSKEIQPCFSMRIFSLSVSNLGIFSLLYFWGCEGGERIGFDLVLLFMCRWFSIVDVDSKCYLMLLSTHSALILTLFSYTQQY